MNNNQLNIVHDRSCNICNKIYSSYHSLWNHNKKFHNQHDHNSNGLVTDLVTNSNSLVNKLLNCKYCNKTFNYKQNKYEHEKKVCYPKIVIKQATELELDAKKINLTILQEDNKKNEIEVKKLKAENEKLKLEIKLHKMNKSNITTNNTNNGNINNGTINNTYVKYNNISYDSLTKKEILEILSKHENAIEESIKKLHFNNNIPEYNNVFITNLKDNYAYAFNGTQFNAINKTELLNELIDNHITAIYFSKYKLKPNIIDKINNLEYKINKSTEKYTDENNKVYKNYKDFKMELIKILIYNLSDKDKLEQIKKLDNIYEKIEIYSDEEIIN